MHAAIQGLSRREADERMEAIIAFSELVGEVVMATLAAVLIYAAIGAINGEKVNLTIRQHVAAMGRRGTTLCKGEDGVRQPLALYHVYSNC